MADQQSIMAGTTISDHFPILLQIQVGKGIVNTRKRTLESLFLDRQLVREVENIWRHHMKTSVNILDKVSRALEQLSMFFRGEAELRYTAYTAQERNCRRVVCALQRLLEMLETVGLVSGWYCAI